MENKKIILIDTNNLAYRAFYALPDTISTSSGTITNAVYGFTSMLMKLIEDQKPDTIVCAFDSKSPTFRHKMFEEYKAQRKKMPAELSNQISLIKEVLGAFNIECLEMDGYEADDIIASISKSIKGKFKETIVVTGDKDMLQLVSDSIKILAMKKGITNTVVYDKQKVREKFGVNPNKISDLLALMGDSSDNIPGVPGIGPKTASVLIERYGGVEEIYNNLSEIKSNKVKNLLIENKEIADLSKRLTKLKSELDIDVDNILNRSFKDVSYSKIEQLFDSLEFRTLKKKLKKIYVSSNLYRDKNDSELIGNRPEIKDKVKKINLKPLTNDLMFKDLYKDTGKKIYITLAKERDQLTDNISGSSSVPGIVLYPGKNYSYFIRKDKLEDYRIREKLKKVLENNKISKSGYDFKNIYKFLKSYGVCLNGEFIDYKILYLLLNPLKADATVNEIMKGLLNIDIKEIEHSNEDLRNEFRNSSIKEDSRQTEIEREREKVGQLKLEVDDKDEKSERNISEYNIEKFGMLLKSISLYSKLESVLIKKVKDEELYQLYLKIEEPLIMVLSEMEYIGINIDKKYLNELIKDYDLNIKKLQEEIFKLCGQHFNINSPQQLSNILYKKLGLTAVKRTKTGLSTNASSLISIYDSHPVIEKILDYREKVKLKNTYIDVLPNLIDPEDMRLHTTYNQLGTTTGRISSSEPNLQNIPVRTELGKQIRKAFIPGKNYELLLTADYSQIELRVLAHMSEDDNLINTFNNGEDIHSRTASEIFNVDYSMVNEDLRRRAKAINFGIIYGMTEYGLKNRLSISEEEAKDYIKMYFERYPRVKKYIKYLIELAYKKGYTTTIFGRKRYIPELGSSNVRLRNLGERLAVNTPIQGSAADIMKLSTVVLFNNLKANNIDCNILLQVHDELVLELKSKDLNGVKKIVRKSMEDCVRLKVKLEVDIKTGKDWYI